MALDYDSCLGRLVSLRKGTKTTQQQLADAMGVGQSAVGNWESRANRLSFDRVVEWLAVFDYEVALLPRKGSAARTAGLVAAAESLSNDELEQLIAVAQNLKTASPTMRALAVRILSSLAQDGAAIAG